MLAWLLACSGKSTDTGETSTPDVETAAPGDSGSLDTETPDTAPDTEPGETDPPTDTRDTAPPEDPSPYRSLAGAHARIDGLLEEEQAGRHVAGAGDLDGDGHADLAIGAMYWWREDTTHEYGQAYVFLGPVEGELTVADAWATWQGGQANHYLGSTLASAGDVDADGLDELWVSAAKTSSSSNDPAFLILVDADQAGDRVTDSARATVHGEQGGDFFGGRLPSPGDVDGDGVPELVAGAYYHDTDLTRAGRVYIASAPTTGNHAIDELDPVTWDGEQQDDRAGHSLDLDDLDGDGLDDLVVGAYYRDTDEAEYAGLAYVLLGPASAGGSLADADAQLHGDEERAMIGRAVATVGDQDGDGYGDLLLGSWREATDQHGLAWVVPGVWDGGSYTVRERAIARLEGEMVDDAFGLAVEGPGDTDGNGTDDLVVGAYADNPGLGWRGAVYLFHGPVSGTVDAGNAERKYHPESGYELVGYTVAGPGDVDDDGLPDLLIGAPFAERGAGLTGSAYLVLGGDP